MRYVWLLLSCLWLGLVQAQGGDDLRLVQAEVNVPALTVWANLPADDGLEREQFTVTVGEHPAKLIGIEPFAETDEGVGYIFLVDVSKSLRSRQLVQIKRALHLWVEGMRENDRAALITFGHKVQHDLQFTNDRFKLFNAINLLATTDMETSLYHGLLEAISVGRSRGLDLPVRRAIVVFSDGIDDSVAGVSLDDVYRQIREYRLPIYSIGFATEPLNEPKREGLNVLSILSRESGGYFLQAEANQLENAYQQQHERINRAYRLRIDCPDCMADGKLQHLSVTWSDGERTLSDGFDMRLLPKHKVTQAPQSAVSDEHGKAGWRILIFAGGLLAFLVGLVLLYRHRLTWKHAQSNEATLFPNPSDGPALRTSANVLTLRLTVVVGIQKGKAHATTIVDRATIGRASNCDLVLDDDIEISGQHAMLLRVGDKLSIRDLNSTNGTLVNGVQIHNEYPLRNGDLILLGRTELRVEFAGSS